MYPTRKNNAGVTLLEIVIALGLWMILLSGVFFLWRFSAQRSADFLARQSALENARVAMDAITVNIQMARIVELTTDGDNILSELRMCQPRTTTPRTCTHGGGPWHDYRLRFDINANPPHNLAFRRLMFPYTANYIAENIDKIQIYHVGDRINITVITGCPRHPAVRVCPEPSNCPAPIVLHSSVCVRGKK